MSKQTSSDLSLPSDPKYSMDWSAEMPSGPSGNSYDPVENFIVPITEITDNSSQNASLKEKENVSKAKSKGKASESKVDRQSRSYVVSGSDIHLYSTRHRVSDSMFKHYLAKRIGYQCSKLKRRLNKQEVKNLFAPVRALCLEILATVRIKKTINVEKKVVMTAVHQATSTQIRWADIVKGRKKLPPAKRDILIAAKEDKVKRQSTEINQLKSRLVEKEKIMSDYLKTISNLNDRIKALEDRDRERKKKDPFSDRKKLATRGNAICHICLPPTVYLYKKPLATDLPDQHGLRWLLCCNCTRRSVFLASGTGLPVFDAKVDGSDIFFYPEGNMILERLRLTPPVVGPNSETNPVFKQLTYVCTPMLHVRDQKIVPSTKGQLSSGKRLRPDEVDK